MRKKVITRLLLLAGIIALAYLISVTGKKGEYITLVGFAQGTTYHIIYESKRGEDFQALVDSLLTDFDRSLSTYQSNSLISRFNRNEPGTLADDKFTTIFNKSYEVFKNTNGAFDITVGPVVNALGFGNTDTLQVDSTMIDSLLQYVGMEKVSLKDGVLIKQNNNILLDVNAIAQGYSVDLVAELLEKKKIRNYMVEIGGEVRARGKNEMNQVWRIGIDKPTEGNMIPGVDLQAILRLNNRSLATSGNYRKYYEKNGIKFVHTIDPNTGYPVVSNLLSATVVASDCTTADAYATALMVFGVERSINFLKENKFLEAYLIYSDQEGRFRVYSTKGLQRFIEEQ
jgi:FAD:protein FMN transferase